MTSVLFILKVLIACLIMMFILHLTLRNKYMVIYMTIVVFAITTYEWLTNQTIRISLQFIQLNMTDLLTIYLVISVMLLNSKNINSLRYPRVIRYLLYLTLIIFIFSMIRGFFLNEFALVIEDIRRLVISFFIPLICYIYLPIEIEDVKVKKIIGNFAKWIVIYCMICWILDIFLGIKIMPPQSDAGSTMRVLRPEQALVVAMFAVYSVYSDLILKRNRYISLGSFSLIIVVILLQHRSTWVALAVGLIYTLIACNWISIRNLNNKTISIKLLLQFLFLLLCVPILLFVFRNSEILTELQLGLMGINANDGGTYNYRQQLWAAHLSGLNSIEWLIGKPFGSGYYVQLTGYFRDITPHSAYVQTIIRCGILGTAALVILLMVTIRESSRRKLIWGTSICLMLLVFWYPYSYSFYASIGLAFVIKSLRLKKGGIEYEKN